MALIKLSAYETSHFDQYKLMPLIGRGTFIKFSLDQIIDHTEVGVHSVVPINASFIGDLEACFACVHEGKLDIFIWDGARYTSILTGDRQRHSLRRRISPNLELFHPVRMLHRDDDHVVLQVEFRTEVVYICGWTDVKQVVDPIVADPYPSLLLEKSKPKHLAVSFGQKRLLFLTDTRNENEEQDGDGDGDELQELHMSPFIREPQFNRVNFEPQCSSRITAIDVSDDGHVLIGHQSGRIVMKQDNARTRIIGTLTAETQFVRFCSIQQTLSVLAVDVYGHIYLYSIQGTRSALVAIFDYPGINDFQLLRFNGSVTVKCLNEYAVLGWDHIIPLAATWV
jgi:hypothetical protein